MTPTISKPLSLELSTPVIPSIRKAWLPAVLVICADVATSALVFASCVVLRYVCGGDFDFSVYAQLWPTLLLQVGIYALFGLYPAIVYHPVTELKRIVAATSVLFLCLGVLLFLFRIMDVYSRLVYLVAWAISSAAVPVARLAVRRRFSHLDWWGYPAIVFGAGDSGRSLVQELQLHPEYGFRVRLWVNPEERQETHWCGVPVIRESAGLVNFARRSGINHAIVALPDHSRPRFLALLESETTTFQRVLVVPNLGAVSTVGVEAGDLCHRLTLEIRRSLLAPEALIMKRLADLSIATCAMLAMLPVFFVVALLLRLDGPVFYRQSRIGRGGRRFTLWKFRSMRPDADRYLATYLAAHPERALEWERDRKLKNDPRITPLGRILRKTSIDELPQLWNVVRGDMSLVGPRPIVTDEIPKYGEGYALYMQVLPGVTGLWQVSGRNDASYIQRVALDSYYIRNWSVWFDLYLLGRTFRAVLAGLGAY